MRHDNKLSFFLPIGTNMNISRTPSTGHSSENPGFSGFTQPAYLSELLGSSQSNTQAATQSSRFQRLVKRMTRFWVKVSFEETDKFLHGLLEKLQLGFKCKPKGIVSYSFFYEIHLFYKYFSYQKKSFSADYALVFRKIFKRANNFEKFWIWSGKLAKILHKKNSSEKNACKYDKIFNSVLNKGDFCM